ncbi:hypothetical protein [Methyloversatilis discipulorum]|uniref:hypothetical protein n=1 Tax=Methyloversatilis discipulorum TaxID=1119528 RepID=UPI0012FAB7F2|nr:hypothetical protein [Methyloversatilis discipulorum]
MWVPQYYPEVVSIVRKANWLIHNFSGEAVDIYNAVDYQHNHHVEGINYRVIVDMNCLQYLLNIVRRPKAHELSRVTAAYLTFFQIADIELDPTYAIYEKINYSDDRADEAISNLELFRGIDNHSLEELAAYALGYEHQLSVRPVISDNRESLRKRLLQYRRLTDWDSLYLCILAITNVATDPSVPRSKKTLKFVNWCISEFRISLSALVYAAALFGKFPAKKMMKYKPQMLRAEKLSMLRNMTWDLYYIDRYMKSWVNKEERSETMMLSADAGLRLTIELAVACQLAGGLDPLRPHLEHELQAVEDASINKHGAARAYKSEQWSSEYRDNLIRKYESELL